MFLGHVIALDPTVKQRRAMQRAAGVARFTWNWALAEWNRQYAAGEKPSAMRLQKQFNALKGERFPWILESPKDANARPFMNLGTAWANFFDSAKGKRGGRTVGRPSFKKKGRCADSFYVSNDQFRFHVDGRRVRLPVIGSVRIREPFRFVGKIVAGSVRCIAGRWFFSVKTDGEFREPTTPTHEIVGVDLGLKTAVVPSRGEPTDAPKPLRRSLRKLARANRTLHRRKEGSSNRRKAREALAIVHAMIANVRKDFLHKTTTKIARETQAVVLEDLNVFGMQKNRKLARAMADVGMGECRRQFEYKGPKFGCVVHIADRWFPSSKRCSGCGNVKDGLTLKQRVYECGVCGLVMDRDLNAACNLEMYPGLPGNGRKATPVDTVTSVRRPRRASVVVEAGTETMTLHVSESRMWGTPS